MGNTDSTWFHENCTSCTFGNNAYEFVLADYVLEDFQNWKVSLNSLDKYNRFYRIVCDPLYIMNIKEFVKELDSLSMKLGKEYEASAPAGKKRQYDYDHIPLLKFIEHFKELEHWRRVIKNLESPFMRLL